MPSRDEKRAAAMGMTFSRYRKFKTKANKLLRENRRRREKLKAKRKGQRYIDALSRRLPGSGWTKQR